jgi:hypothetical protein
MSTEISFTIITDTAGTTVITLPLIGVTSVDIDWG